MKNALYWTSVVIGILIIVVMYVISKKIINAPISKPVSLDQEPFVGAVSIDKYFEGDKATIPYKDKVYAYLSSFSGIQSDRSTSIFSGAGVPLWRSLVHEGLQFNVVGTNLPGSIENGLPMKGTRLIGPPSEDAAYPNTNYVLPSFTICFYANWKSLDFDTNAPIILFRMYAENPNHVQLSVREMDANNVALEAVVGNANSVYSWTIPKTTLLTQGTGTLYAFVYNREEKRISFHVGNAIKYPRVLTESTIVKLGNTPMDINFNQNWDASLRAFIFYRAAITDFGGLYDYLGEQASGKNMLLDSVESEKAALSQTLQSCSNNQEEFNKLMDELNLTREQLYNIRQMYRKCTQKPEDIKPNSFRRWQVDNGIYPGKYENLNQCKELDVKTLSELSKQSRQQLVKDLVTAFVQPIKQSITAGATTTKAGATMPSKQIYTSFPNASFQTPTKNTSIYVPTPYPEKRAEPPQKKEIVTSFDNIPEATLLPSAQPTTNTTTTSTIPTATIVPRPDTAVSGVKLLYADPSNTDRMTGAQLTQTISAPTVSTSTTTGGTSTTQVDKSSIFNTLRTMFA